MEKTAMEKRKTRIVRIVIELVTCGLMVALSWVYLSHGFRPTQTYPVQASYAENRSVFYVPPVFNTGTINPNTASAQELDALPGVGSVIAENFIEEREKNGRFYFPEDLVAVNGIGKKKLADIKDDIQLP